MISHSKKCIFLHIPKTGGYVIKDILKEHSQDKLTKGHPSLIGPTAGWRMFPERGYWSDQVAGLMHPKLAFYYQFYNPQLVEEYCKFTVVRNPWERLVSYTSYINGGAFDYEILKSIVYFPEKNIGPGEVTQLQYLKDPSGDVNVDRVVRQENFTEEMQKLFVDLDIPFEEGIFSKKKNTTEHQSYVDYYKEDEKKAIANICAEEIDLFKYEYGK